MCECWNLDVNGRPSFTEISSFFQSLSDEAYSANYDQHRQPTSPKMDDIVVIRNTTLSNKDKQIVKELSPFYSSTPGRFGKKTTTTSLLRLPSKMGQLGALYTQTCCGFITPVMMHQQIPQQPLLHLTSTTKTST
ncbi:unnamed protein product [Orchesella dallaii]|uniref:Uncharacterized protein n=1 Tax=Orchesella dallaii TaxID=48710 RepID=A0ABP1PHJ8_9HEXA